MFCANCPHFDYEHEDVALGEPCQAILGAWGEMIEPGETSGDRCLCPGFTPEPIAVRA